MAHGKLWGLVLQGLTFKPLEILALGLVAQFLQNHFGLLSLGQHIQALVLNRDARFWGQRGPYIA
jgi:hypothetical protein